MTALLRLVCVTVQYGIKRTPVIRSYRHQNIGGSQSKLFAHCTPLHLNPALPQSHPPTACTGAGVCLITWVMDRASSDGETGRMALNGVEWLSEGSKLVRLSVLVPRKHCQACSPRPRSGLCVGIHPTKQPVVPGLQVKISNAFDDQAMNFFLPRYKRRGACPSSFSSSPFLRLQFHHTTITPSAFVDSIPISS